MGVVSIRVDCHPCMGLEEPAAEMVRLANLLHVFVESTWNGVEMCVAPNMTTEQVIRTYRDSYEYQHQSEDY